LILDRSIVALPLAGHRLIRAAKVQLIRRLLAAQGDTLELVKFPADRLRHDEVSVGFFICTWSTSGDDLMKGIDTSQIAAMAAQMKTMLARMQPVVAPVGTGSSGPRQSGIDFSKAMKTQLDQVNALDLNAQKLGERFSLGDDKVNLSDVMMASQKSSIALQATIQVRNKLVSTYRDIMNMQI